MCHGDQLAGAVIGLRCCGCEEQGADSHPHGAYRSRLYRREGYHPFSDSQGAFEAKVLNVLDDGRLVLLDTEGKARMYAFKEVVFIIKN